MGLEQLVWQGTYDPNGHGQKILLVHSVDVCESGPRELT